MLKLLNNFLEKVEKLTDRERNVIMDFVVMQNTPVYMTTDQKWFVGAPLKSCKCGAICKCKQEHQPKGAASVKRKR